MHEVSEGVGAPHQDDDSLIDKLKSLGAWWHHLDSTWLIETEHTPKVVRDVLK